MRLPVELEHQPRPAAVEVNDVRPNRLLPTGPVAREPSAAECGPEDLLGGRQLPAEFSCLCPGVWIELHRCTSKEDGEPLRSLARHLAPPPRPHAPSARPSGPRR